MKFDPSKKVIIQIHKVMVVNKEEGKKNFPFPSNEIYSKWFEITIYQILRFIDH